jgi:hypothetical protein
MGTIPPVHRNIPIGGAIIVVSDNKILLWRNDESNRNLEYTFLETTNTSIGYGRIVPSEEEETIGEIIGLGSRIVNFKPRALVPANGRVDH